MLKGLVFTKYNFEYLVIECRDFDRLQSYLKTYDYALDEKLTYHDYLFKDLHSEAA